eukprot:TRINITY_DN19622_c0_g1_i1.p1 TRINITY_DN19622_c0_g1~~TRINITY_DN19622_c0_g1_i1.p1  ORF type:complete len:486 (+),score=128.67 TRINITY_DN19622_c0_g1_i1:75-1532(+)
MSTTLDSRTDDSATTARAGPAAREPTAAPQQRRLTLLTSRLPLAQHANEEAVAQGAIFEATVPPHQLSASRVRRLREQLEAAPPPWRPTWRRSPEFGWGDDGGFAREFDRLVRSDEGEWRVAKRAEARRGECARVHVRRQRQLEKFRKRQRRSFIAALARGEPYAVQRLGQYRDALMRDAAARRLSQATTCPPTAPQPEEEDPQPSSRHAPTRKVSASPWWEWKRDRDASESSDEPPEADSPHSSDEDERWQRLAAAAPGAAVGATASPKVDTRALLSTAASPFPGGTGTLPERRRPQTARRPAPPSAGRQRGPASAPGAGSPQRPPMRLRVAATPTPPAARQRAGSPPASGPQPPNTRRRLYPRPRPADHPAMRRALDAARSRPLVSVRWGTQQLLAPLSSDDQAVVWRKRASHEGAEFNPYRTLRGAPPGSSKWSYYLFHLDREGDSFVASQLDAFDAKRRARAPDGGAASDSSSGSRVAEAP